MNRPSRALLIAAVLLLTAGLALYHLGSQTNVAAESADPILWERAPGDI